MKLTETLANNLKTLRGNTSQESFARKLGISQSTLARLENCTQNVTINTIEQITKALKCDVDDLFK
jgi:transcriptional regulator with XRE-family HTH domain